MNDSKFKAVIIRLLLLIAEDVCCGRPDEKQSKLFLEADELARGYEDDSR